MVRGEDATLCGIQVSGFERWSDRLHERGNQSIKNQLKMVLREEEEEEVGEEEGTW